jgi:diaminohydroxyphosphoribosylaminopyrimidine deaminase / 5-amino-6-(5-phosphoribosylamino)uracil reductase
VRDEDERFMRRALELARSWPHASPNPRVGVVVVRDGGVIAEGRHEGAGTPHAEMRALEGVDATGATLYVNLEPCAHHGRTPPCAPALVAAGIVRVVAAHEDPDPRVRGRGFAALAVSGVEVTTGVLEEEAERTNAAYLHHARTGLPLVSLKVATSLDGRLSAADGSARWITGPATRARVHARRAEVDAVVVGAGTVVADDPQLTARGAALSLPSGAIAEPIAFSSGAIAEPIALSQPARVVVDARGRVSCEARVFAPGADVIFATTDRCPHERQTSWKEAGAEVAVFPEASDGVDLGALLRWLGERPMLDVMCEGGARLATSLLSQGLVDRLEIHLGPVVLGSGGACLGDVGVTTMTDARRWRLLAVERSGDDAVLVLEADCSPAS